MSSQNNVPQTHCEYEVEIKDNITIVKIPETYDDKPLTEAQKELLLLLEEEFTNRYTDDDKDYVATVKRGNTTPPLVPYYRPFRNRKTDDRSRGFKRSWDGGDKYSNYPQNKKPNYGNNYNRYR